MGENALPEVCYLVSLLPRGAGVASAAVSLLLGTRAGSLAQSGLCASRTDAALLTNDLSNLPSFFNPSQHHCYIGLCIDSRAVFGADVFLES